MAHSSAFRLSNTPGRSIAVHHHDLQDAQLYGSRMVLLAKTDLAILSDEAYKPQAPQNPPS